jgi:hypothetical protein
MATAEQQERARVYRDAAGEHVGVAVTLYEDGSYIQCNYLAGLAVECMCRAYRLMEDPEFDARHDLTRLFDLSKLGSLLPDAEQELAFAALSAVVGLWANEHRFLSEAALRRKWKGMKLDRGIKGDFVKELNRRLVIAAQELVSMGAASWTSCFAK